jgi:large subunit ribosomal protein L15
MAQLHEIRIKKKKARRVGRGGKRGTTSGRGQKGQKSRAGRRMRPAARDLIIRLPKRRGFKNKPVSAKPFLINLRDLAGAKPRLAAVGFKVTPENLKRAGFLPEDFRGKIKILGKGRVDFPITVSGVLISGGAAEKVKKAGGQINNQPTTE